MAKDGSVKISAEFDQSKAVSEMNRFASIAKGGLKTVGMLGKTAIATIAGVGTALTTAGAIGVRYNAQMEQYMASFETLLGNQELAQRHMEELKTFAAKTPFEMPGIADASRTLLSFGVENENVMKILNQLGDVSLGNQEKFSALALVYGQVSSQGKLMGQDLLQCINAGFNPLQVISEHTGQSMAELKEQMSKGAISAEMVAQAFAWATEEGGMFHEGLLKQSKTFDGLVSTLKDNANALVGEVAKPISESMTKELLPAAIETIEGMTEAYEKEGLEGLSDATGKAFADVITKTGSYAPKMVKVSVDFIKSFVKGIKNNKNEIKEAAFDLVKTLKDELLNLLPKSVREPIEEAFEEVERSLKEGGLRAAGEYVVKLFGKIGKGAMELGKSALPILTKSLDFCADHLDTIVPLTTAFFVAMKSYAVVTQATKAVDGMTAAWKAAVAVLELHEAKSRLNMVTIAGGTTLFQTAVGVLSGKIELATAAQWLWNAAMNANPIGIMIAAIGALVGGIALYVSHTEKAKTSAEELAASNEELTESYAGVGEAAQSFSEGIATAGTIFDEFNENIIVSQEKQQELIAQMDSIQQEITAITGTYCEERKALTDSEIMELDRLFEKMHEQAAAELEAQQAYQTATEERARLLAETHKGTAEEYAAASQSIINTAEQTRASVIQKAEEQFNEELALLQLRLQNDQSFTQAMYEAEALAAQERYNVAVEGATTQCADTLTVLTEGYANRATALSEANATMKQLQDEEILENQNYNAQKAELERQLKENMKKSGEFDYKRQYELSTKLQTLNQNHEKKISEIHKKMSKTMDEEAQNQAGTLMAMSANTSLYGGELETKTKTMADEIIKNFESMPEPAKQAMIDTMEGMLQGLREKEPELYAKAEEISNNLIAKLKKPFRINSPSKTTRRIFNYVMKGNILGLEDQEKDLYSTAERLSNGVLQRFSGMSPDVSDLKSRMEEAVRMRSARMKIDSAQKLELADNNKEKSEDNFFSKLETVIMEAVSEGMDGKAFKVGEREFARLIEEVT